MLGEDRGALALAVEAPDADVADVEEDHADEDDDHVVQAGTPPEPFVGGNVAEDALVGGDWDLGVELGGGLP